MAVANIMMDARPLYPTGHHPVQLNYSLDLLSPVSPLPRAGRNIRYFYIDFGLSARFPEGSPSLVIGDVGRNADVPELSDTVPYDAFKVDIFSLGHLYSKLFEQVNRFCVLYVYVAYFDPAIYQLGVSPFTHRYNNATTTGAATNSRANPPRMAENPCDDQ